MNFAPIEAIEEKLAGMLSPKRFSHSQRVARTAVVLAERFGANRDKAALAGILHDCAREIELDEMMQIAEKFIPDLNDIERLQPVLLHAPVGAYLAKKKFAVADEEVLSAILCHTVGGVGMSRLDKIIYLADFVEPGRTCTAVEEIRRILAAEGDGVLDAAMLRAYNSSIEYTIEKKEFIHMATIEGRNEILLQISRS